MEDEVSYATVTFQANGVPAHEKQNDLSVIYDEVKTAEENLDTSPVLSGNEKKPPLCTLLHLGALSLGIICTVLVSVLITLVIQFNAVMLEQSNLTAQTQQLWTEKAELERQALELTQDRNRLNWTIGVIMEYKNFPVNTHCPQKVCKACLDGWLQFQSKCYLFMEPPFFAEWKNWEESQKKCREMNADLVVIDSQEEQEFINNQTEAYDTSIKGYWIGLKRNSKKENWTWVNGRNFTVTYWMQQEVSSRIHCALSQPRAPPLANWQKTSCDMWNRWICEMRALINEAAA